METITHRIEVWHRTDDNEFREISVGDNAQLASMYDYPVDLSRVLSADPVLTYVHHQAFRVNNHVDGSVCEVVPDSVRSLSVGDVLVIRPVDGSLPRVFTVDRTGWRDLNVPVCFQ